MLLKSTFRIFITPFLLLITLSSFAQDGWKVGFGVSPGIPTKKPFEFNLGGDVRVQKTFSDNFTGMLTAGFTHFFEKANFDGYPQYGSPYNVIPVKVGGKLFVSDVFYAAGEVGAGFGFEQWHTSFLWSPSLGFAFKNGLDVSIRYEDFTRSSVTKDFSLRLAYGIGASKLKPHKRISSDNSWKLGVSVNPAFITASDDFALGGEVGVYKSLSHNIEAYATAGFTRFFNAYQTYSAYPLKGGSEYVMMPIPASKNIVPVKAGLRVYAGERFYISGDAGAAFAPDGDVAFTYSPSIGLAFKNGLDFGVKFDGYAGYYVPNTLALKLGYRFKL